MSGLQFFFSVPGMMIPGMAQPGKDGQRTQGPYLYLGQGNCYYLDYLDLGTGRTLAPVAGGYYAMIAVSSRAGLTVPPPGRPWTPGGTPFAPQVRRQPVPPGVSHGHYPGSQCGHCDPSVRDAPPPPRRTPGPDVAPQDAGAMMHAARAHNAARHAAIALGEAQGGG